MPQIDYEPSAQQLRLLKRAESAPSFVVARSLFEVLEELNEPLHPGWREIWMRVRDEVAREREAPEHIIEQIDKAVESIEWIDSGIGQLRLAEHQKVCLLLGAGASASPPSSIPTVVELLPELWRRARKLGRDDIDRLANWCDEQGISNIEDLLTAAYLANFSARSASISALLNYFLFRDSQMEGSPPRRAARRYGSLSQVDASSVALFQETLQGLFGLLTGTMIPAPPNAGHDAVVNFIKAHSNSSIITTNYDGCIDESLVRADVGFSTHVSEVPKSDESCVDLIKIHGSINWSYCDSCHDAREFDLLTLKNGYEKDTISYAVVGICRNCGGQRRPLLIPPMGLKFVMFPNLIRLWNLAREHIESSDLIIVVGFSFSEADSYINKIIERSMSFNSNQRMIICDPNSSLVSTLRNRYSARIEGFTSSRVLPAVGSGHEILPRVLETILSGPSRSSKGRRSRGARETLPEVDDAA